MTEREAIRRSPASSNVAIGAAGTFVLMAALLSLLPEAPVPAPAPSLRGTIGAVGPAVAGRNLG